MEDIIFKLDRENIQVAPLGARVASMMIDDFIVSMLVIIAFFDSFKIVKDYEEMLILVDKLFFFIFLAYIIYHFLFVAIYGKTLGKIIFKIRVIDVDTMDKPGFVKSFFRSLLRYFDEAFFYLGMLYAIVDPLNRALHDVLTRVVVVKDY